ncbi:MAG: heavy metal translocating P-type ATPase [Pseudomonadota bacterium]
MSVAAPLLPEITGGCPSGLAPPSEGAPGDLDAFVRRQGETAHLRLLVRGAKCGGCLSKIEKAVCALPGVEVARLNLSTGQFEVSWRGPLTPLRIGKTISDLGYGVSAKGEDPGAEGPKNEERQLLISMGVAGFAAANIMLLSVSVWAGHGEMGGATRQVLHALSGLIALPVIVYAGRHFFQSAFAVLRRGHANMDVPISLALVLAFGVSVFETLNHGAHAYFDACVMLLFFLLIGRFLDARLRRRAHAAAHDLAALQSRSVSRLDGAGAVTLVRASEIRAGDRVLLAPGERAVVDLTVESEGGEVDESLVTGESLPRLLARGATLYAGTVNLGAALTGIVRGEADDSLLSEIARLLEAGEQRRSTYRQIADRAVSLYVPFVHTTACLAFIGWWLFGPSVQQAVMVAVTTLIITCPCALALAAPVVQVVASGRLFRRGVFLKSGDALERLAEVDHVVFDKTGTLTLGTPQLCPLTPEGETALIRAASLARASRHPLSRALTAAAGPGKVAEGVREVPGLGLEATIDGAVCRLGSAEWAGACLGAKTNGTPHRGPILYYGEGDTTPIAFPFTDAPRGDTAAATAALRQAGLSLEILSGDRASAVDALAKTLGIDQWTASASPQGKAARLEALRRKGRRVLMVGDGINDAPALALAHASLAPGGAMDISQSAADAVYGRGLSAIPEIRSAAIGAHKAMRQNFALAALYNVIAVPIAVTGHVTPLIAAIAMSASSLIVTLNALRQRP